MAEHFEEVVNRRLQALETRVDEEVMTIAQHCQELQTFWAESLSSAIEGLRKELRAEFRAGLARIELRLDRHEERFDRYDKRFDDQDRRLDRYDKRFDDQNRRFDRYDKRFDDHDKRFDQHDRRFDRIEMALDEILRRLPPPRT